MDDKINSIDLTGRLISKARRLLAYGGLDGVIQRPLFDSDGQPFPHFAVDADGCRFTDSTGQSYIDWVNGWGPVLLGYRHPIVEAAIREQLSAGPTLSLMNPIEVRVAEQLTELIPCAEMVAFAKNGSDSLTAAIRIARSVTGKDMILQFGFHGFHDWYTCTQQGVNGILPVLENYVASFEYNNIEHLRQRFQQYRNRVAAIVMEPVNMWMPDQGYLQEVKRIAEENGALLVFDEMVTAFRVARGGAQELFEVVPDLACIGKGMANGMPLSAVVGLRQHMQHLPGCGFGMTFRGETLSLAAAHATLKLIQENPVVEHISRIGSSLRDGFHEMCQELDVRCELSGPSGRMTFVFQDQDHIGWSDARARFLRECLKHGVMTNGNILPSYAHDEQSVDETLSVFRKSLEKLRSSYGSATADADRSTPKILHGFNPVCVNGFIDQLKESKFGLQVDGWLIVDSTVVDAVQVHSQDGTQTMARQVEREDIADAFPECERALMAGFSIQLPHDQHKLGDGYKFSIIAIDRGSPVFRCLVNVEQTNFDCGPWSLADGVIYV